MKAVNWNKKEDDFSLVFWKQNIAQFWTEEGATRSPITA